MFGVRFEFWGLEVIEGVAENLFRALGQRGGLISISCSVGAGRAREPGVAPGAVGMDRDVAVQARGDDARIPSNRGFTCRTSDCGTIVDKVVIGGLDVDDSELLRGVGALEPHSRRDAAGLSCSNVSQLDLETLARGCGLPAEDV